MTTAGFAYEHVARGAEPSGSVQATGHRGQAGDAGQAHSATPVRCASGALAEPKDGHEGLVNTPLLFWGHPAYKLTQSSRVDGPGLLNQDAGALPEQVDLRAE